ncbi:MAG: phosphonate ABC transporter ATP-binding protein [Planctomycetota bacterium]|jgi:phosphonate transport system ATP-binding protein
MEIRLDAVSRDFNGQGALRDLQLDVEAGECIALVGPSGAGKTTLFRLLNLSLRPDAGQVFVDGRDVATLAGEERRDLRARIATIHQHHDLIGRLSAVKNVLAGRLGRWSMARGLRAFTLPSRQEVGDAWKALDRVGIPEKLWDRTDRLSGGQRQRVAIARALYQDAELILADEPVASVDPALATSLLELLTETARADGRTLLVNLHQPTLARKYFDRIIGLRDGTVLFDGPAGNADEETLRSLFNGSAVPAAVQEEPETPGVPRTCRPTNI